MRYEKRSLNSPTPNSKRADDFLKEIIEVSKKHGLSICHEDRHGEFQIKKYEGRWTKWLLEAADET
jgi:hypothetical protein